MPVETISYKNTNYFSLLSCNYIAQKPDVTMLYNRYPSMLNFKAQLKEKQQSYCNRAMLVKVLKKQYAQVTTTPLVQKNIQLLNENNTFTITTGHQLNLFTGPLYFFYKIISAINLCETLKQHYPKNNFVPVYWMATEDHDFEEINHFNFKDNRVEWQRSFGGAVGELSTEGLEEVYNFFSDKLGPGKNAKYLKELFKNAYINHTNLTEATRYLVNELFQEYGLVCIDANAVDLKKEFVPYIKQELLTGATYKEVTKTINSFFDSYKVQVNPREINLFYLTKGSRERIVFENGVYKVNTTSKQWTEKELLAHVEEVPERFSPNVLLRPLYQEVVLPNLCYIGGGGELAYWLELKSTFEAFNVVFPMLQLRNSALIINPVQQKKMNKLKLSTEELFLKQEDLIAKKTKEFSKLAIDFSNQKQFLKEQFKQLYRIAKKTDASFLGAVAAQEKKQVKGLANLEKRLLKAEKKVFSERLNRFTTFQNELFPNLSLQERNRNFSEMYLEYGDEFIPILKESLQPLSDKFTIIT